MPLLNVNGVYFYEFCRVEKQTLFLVDNTEKMTFTWIRRPLCMRFLKVVSLLLQMFTNLFDVVVEVTAVPPIWIPHGKFFGLVLAKCFKILFRALHFEIYLILWTCLANYTN